MRLSRQRFKLARGTKDKQHAMPETPKTIGIEFCTGLRDKSDDGNETGGHNLYADDLTFQLPPGDLGEYLVQFCTNRRVLKAGHISCGGAAIDCTVRNLSRTGAALEVASPSKGSPREGCR